MHEISVKCVFCAIIAQMVHSVIVENYMSAHKLNIQHVLCITLYTIFYWNN